MSRRQTVQRCGSRLSAVLALTLSCTHPTELDPVRTSARVQGGGFGRPDSHELVTAVVLRDTRGGGLMFGRPLEVVGQRAQVFRADADSGRVEHVASVEAPPELADRFDASISGAWLGAATYLELTGSSPAMPGAPLRHRVFRVDDTGLTPVANIPATAVALPPGDPHALAGRWVFWNVRARHRTSAAGRVLVEPVIELQTDDDRRWRSRFVYDLERATLMPLP